MFEPIVDAALIGLVGVIVGIGGYALQNWQIKKAERERSEYVTKREKYEIWIKKFANSWYQQKITGKSTSELDSAINEVSNMLLLYGSDPVVNALVKLFKPSSSESEKANMNRLLNEVILAMRKDLISTNLKVDDFKFLTIK